MSGLIMALWIFLAALLPPTMPLSAPTPAAKPTIAALTHTVTSVTAQPIVAAHYTYSVLGPPTISRATFCNVLAVYRSPIAQGCSSYYQQAATAGVDPAMALVWLEEESEYFTDGGSSKANHNWGNLVCGSRYCYYPTYTAGLHAWLMLIRKYALAWHRPTIAAIMPMYAPDSDIQGRIREAERLVDKWRR